MYFEERCKFAPEIEYFAFEPLLPSADCASAATYQNVTYDKHRVSNNAGFKLSQ
jgi:hypothetical protein